MAKVVGFDESAKKRITCKNCAAIVEYVSNEVHRGSSTDYTGFVDHHKYITCPNCGNEVIVRWIL